VTLTGPNKGGLDLRPEVHGAFLSVMRGCTSSWLMLICLRGTASLAVHSLPNQPARADGRP
jgi:hypothetical protein